MKFKIGEKVIHEKMVLTISKIVNFKGRIRYETVEREGLFYEDDFLQPIFINAHIDGDCIVSADCPICGRYTSFISSPDKEEVIEFGCGHKFRFKKIISQIEIVQ